MKLLKNKTIVVTGGSRGIGKSIVLKLAEHGANVVFTYVSSSEMANSVVKEAEKNGVSITAFKSDASKFEDCELLINNVIKKFNHLSNEYLNKEIQRPDYWGGYIIKPIKYEFWQGGENRLHDRIRYTWDKNFWKIVRLSP